MSFVMIFPGLSSPMPFKHFHFSSLFPTSARNCTPKRLPEYGLRRARCCGRGLGLGDMMTSGSWEYMTLKSMAASLVKLGVRLREKSASCFWSHPTMPDQLPSSSSSPHVQSGGSITSYLYTHSKLPSCVIILHIIFFHPDETYCIVTIHNTYKSVVVALNRLTYQHTNNHI